MRMLTVRRVAAAIFAVSAAAALAGCGSSGSGTPNAAGSTSPPIISSPPHHHHKKTPTATPTATPTPTPVVAVTKTVTASPTAVASSAAAAVQNLVAGPAVRSALVAVGAKSHHLKASDYTGLVPGETYYAFDPATSMYWAGAGLVPSPSSMAAQVSVQDDGSYLLFSMPSGGTWSAVNVGLSGVAGSTCPLKVPADVLAVWHWKAGNCRPPS